ncbi:ATP-binding protein [Marinisporobacter balticus]|uniref:Serine/threonine-protein kinase RsbW n=1 Tax=Marinisporobacter balticus TaxID=2018667 RepID=A0A4R2KVU8_9FIRM|nr:ATP-binding protein [Marinisporobacter balticus]TCO78074.1 serine/threonine-protein kinase RsbW [Marinisporobacter balticus]
MMENTKCIEKVEKKVCDHFSISVPNKPEYVNVVRLTTSAIASRMGFNIEQIEDIKVAIAEACTNAIKHGLCNHNQNFDINFFIDDEKIIIDVIDKGTGFASNEIEKPDLTSPKEGGLGIFIIQSLMDKVEIVSEIGKGTRLQMIKYLGDDI